MAHHSPEDPRFSRPKSWSGRLPEAGMSSLHLERLEAVLKPFTPLLARFGCVLSRFDSWIVMDQSETRVHAVGFFYAPFSGYDVDNYQGIEAEDETQVRLICQSLLQALPVSAATEELRASLAEPKLQAFEDTDGQVNFFVNLSERVLSPDKGQSDITYLN